VPHFPGQSYAAQKKSKRGKATPLRNLDLIDSRLKRAAEMHAQKMKESGQ